jgi:hypothetical protein
MRTFSSIHCSFRSGDCFQTWILTFFDDFQETFSPKKPGFEQPDYMGLKGPSVVYNFLQDSAWDVQKRPQATIIFLSKTKVVSHRSRAIDHISDTPSYQICVILDGEYGALRLLTISGNTKASMWSPTNALI